MPDLTWNKHTWERGYPWQDGGEEWSTAWGGSEAQWFGSILPRLHRFLPAGRILEIAPGFGRWSKFLIPACHEYAGIDLSEKCTALCRELFADCRHTTFLTNDGMSLSAIHDGIVDLVFSFDSLVHADYDVMASYVPQILRKLTPNGVAFLHHSNLMVYENRIGELHGRSLSMSAAVMSDLIRNAGGTVLIQEIVNWGGEHLIDCLTLFSRRETYPGVEPVRFENPNFMNEAILIQRNQSPYSSPQYTVRAPDATPPTAPSTTSQTG